MTPRRLLAAFGPVAGLAAVYAAFALAGPSSFATAANAETIARQTAIVGSAALGATLVIVAGGIDLSIGSIVACGTVVIAGLLQAGASPVAAAAGGIASGLVFGALNGWLVTRLRVGPFIVTLGTLLVIRGLAKGLAHEQKIDAPLTWIADLLAQLPPERAWLLVPPGVWIVVVLAVAVAAVLRRGTFGRAVVATGSNEDAARLSGIPVDGVKLGVYVLGGGFAGLAGLFQFSRLTVGDPTVATGLELDVIAAVVIGGGSLAGGEGSVLGSLVGALIMTTIRSGCSQMGLANWIQEMLTGAIIVGAVALDRLRRR